MAKTTKKTPVKVEKKKAESPRRSNRLSVKKRKFVVSKMKEEVENERKRAVRGTKKTVNKLTSEYRRQVFETMRKKDMDSENAVKTLIGIREKFKNGIKAVDMERESLSTVPLSPVREEASTPEIEMKEGDGEE